MFLLNDRSDESNNLAHEERKIPSNISTRVEFINTKKEKKKIFIQFG
jgi:hypothetical protein